MEPQTEKQTKFFKVVFYDSYQEIVEWMQSEGFTSLIEWRTPYLMFAHPLGYQVAKAGDIIIQTKKGCTPMFEVISNTEHVNILSVLKKIEPLFNET